MKASAFLFLILSAFLFSCEDAAVCSKIDTTPAGSLHMDRYVDFSLYQDDILIEQAGGWLLMRKVDDSHINLRFEDKLRYVAIETVLVTGEFLDVRLSYESDSGSDNWWIVDEEDNFNYISIEGWMKDTGSRTRGECMNHYYDIWDIRINFTSEDGREYRYEIIGTY